MPHERRDRRVGELSGGQQAQVALALAIATSCFWAFQGIETGIYLVLTLSLLALVAWWIDRRVC